jgi:hypothetical protein
VIPTVPMPRHRAVAWPIPARVALVERLAAMGVTLTEASDARELGGRPSLRHLRPVFRRHPGLRQRLGCPLRCYFPTHDRSRHATVP